MQPAFRNSQTIQEQPSQRIHHVLVKEGKLDSHNF